MEELDSSLVVSETVSKFLHDHPETTEMEELSHAIEALDEKERKDVQFFLESKLNDLVSKMNEEERNSYLARWEKYRADGHYEIRVSFTNSKTYCFNNKQCATEWLWRFCQKEPVWILDWVPKDSKGLAIHMSQPNWMLTMGRICAYTRKDPSILWEAINKRLNNRLPLCRDTRNEVDLVNWAKFKDEYIPEVLGASIQNPSVEMCTQWMNLCPIIINSKSSVTIHKKIWVF
jgi:hypothetical protein